MDKEAYIRNICEKLVRNEQLTAPEINSVVSALRESTQCLQTPYYEVIYHDEYDNTEHRVMNPVYSKEIEDNFYGHKIKEDFFEIKFRRLCRPKEDSHGDN